MVAATNAKWANELGTCFGPRSDFKHITLIGVGNAIRGDDSVGMYIASNLRRKYGANPKKSLRIEPVSSPEAAFSGLDRRRRGAEAGDVVIFDAIESDLPPGSIIFSNIQETKYGFFATHNVPLKLIPSVAANAQSVFVLGIQPENTEIGEDLSKTVNDSADRVVETIGKFIENMR